MKKVLFLVNAGKISSNENGGAAVYYSHLELLFKAGYQVILLVVLWDDKQPFTENDYTEILPFVKEIKQYQSIVKKPTKGFNRIYNAIFSPAKFEYYFINQKNNYFLETFVAKNNIDLVWCEWRWTATWANASKLNIPVIYAHHDWEYKLAKLRQKRSLLQKFHTFQKKRVEFQLVKNVTACISGSPTEANEIEEISGKKALYLPTTYNAVDLNLSANKTPNIIHLGGMGTTANRLGLERFLDVCWTNIKKENSTTQLIVIGSLSQAHVSLKTKLEAAQIICKGFVKDLTTVLHPNDIHIIPWEYNTGTRTRLPVVFNYQQLLIATKASVKAFPEVKNEKNALLCNTLEEMTVKINSALKNEQISKELSANGRATFLTNFTPESQVDRLKKFIEK